MRSNRFVQELLHPAQNARDIGPLGVGGDGVREELGHRPHAAELVGPFVGEDRLVDAVHQCGTRQEGDLLVVVYHQHLDRPLPCPHELEALQATEDVEIDVPFRAERPEVIHSRPHCVNKSALLLHGHLARPCFRPRRSLAPSGGCGRHRRRRRSGRCSCRETRGWRG